MLDHIHRFEGKDITSFLSKWLVLRSYQKSVDKKEAFCHYHAFYKSCFYLEWYAMIFCSIVLIHQTLREILILGFLLFFVMTFFFSLILHLWIILKSSFASNKQYSGSLLEVFLLLSFKYIGYCTSFSLSIKKR